MKCRQRQEAPELERKIRANDAAYNSSFTYSSNYISTSKYNFITFLPKNLFEQFRRLANAYFLVLLILQLIPQISSLTPYTTIIPLVAVFSLTAIKDAIDDVQRHRSDNQVNNRKSWILRDGKLVEEIWYKVVVGDIVRMENNQFVAADLFLISTSEPNSLSYIETAELDGETNLKVRQAIPDTAVLGDDLVALRKFNGHITCEPPNNKLGKFEGILEWNGKTYALDNDKLLLRGCVLRNTNWCFGLVVFAGKDTKLMMNCGKTVFKQTHIDRLVNILIIGIFVFLIVACLICSFACTFWEIYVGTKFRDYLPWEEFIPVHDVHGSIVIGVMVFFSYIIILNTVVPISLYVSVEVIRLVHSIWINWDREMYDPVSDTPARSRTTTLNEELGQIQYIFSDKTGTLTRNIMTFNKCTIDGKSFGGLLDAEGNPLEVTAATPKLNFSWNPMHEAEFRFFDQGLLDQVRSGHAMTCEFFRVLALCHTVMPEEKNGKILYQAQSPDEGALVSAARNFGYVFRSRTPNSIVIEENGQKVEFELLCILDFDNVRKRMSVILRKDGKIKLYCKGADTVIFQRLHADSSSLQEVTTSHLNEFAQEGLRTLCLAMKEISQEYWTEWSKRYHTASTAMDSRESKCDELFEEIEQDLELIGATAIEDKLQDGVPQAIANLMLAGIKIWVLTGDKQETAINIGYSCKLLTDEMEEIYIVNGDSYIEVEEELRQAISDMKSILGAHGGRTDIYSFSNSMHNNLSHRMPDTGKTPSAASSPTEDVGSFALIINGHSLVHALEPRMELVLLECACMCRAVICCRVTPLQKALVVELVKRHKKAITLSIGDGANDVSMIKTAHIGIGISGQEGMQAVLASDFSIAQFRFVERLLLVHGRWSYFRMCKFLKYFFYKNFAFTLCHFWYAFVCGFSAQNLYDPSFISFYNVLYTSLPVLALGVFDQDVNDQHSLRFPKLYGPGQHDMLFNSRVFAQSVGEGVITSLILFFIPYGAFHDAVRSDGHDMVNHMSFGVCIASFLIVAVTLRCALDTSYWTGFNHFVIWGSIVFYYGCTFVMYADFMNYQYMGTARNVMFTGLYWFTLILTITILLVPIIAERFYLIDTRPTLSDKIRLKQKISKSKSNVDGFVMRRQSTMRRSQRSMHAGYAFSHQQGFGRLITSGLNMRTGGSDTAKSPRSNSDGRAQPPHTHASASNPSSRQPVVD